MSNPWHAKVQAFLARSNAAREKNRELDSLVSSLVQLLPEHLKKLLPDTILTILKKYGYNE